MFDNIGGKIKTYAKVVAWIGIILSVILGLIQIIGGAELSGSYYGASGGTYVVTGILTIVVGILASWIGSFFVYGFGELIERVQSIDEKASLLASKAEEE